MQPEHRTHLAFAAQLELAQTAPLFDPAKNLLDAAAGMDRLAVALVAGGAAIDGGATRSAGVLGNVRRHANPPELSDHGLGVVVLVGHKGFLVGTGDVSCHSFGSIPLSGARRLGDAAVNDQGMAIVHEHVAVAPQGALYDAVAGQGWMGLEFAAQQRVGIDGGAVGLVAELDAAEIPFRPLLPFFRLTKALARA